MQKSKIVLSFVKYFLFTLSLLSFFSFSFSSLLMSLLLCFLIWKMPKKIKISLLILITIVIFWSLIQNAIKPYMSFLCSNMFYDIKVSFWLLIYMRTIFPRHLTFMAGILLFKLHISLFLSQYADIKLNRYSRKYIVP